MQRVVMIQHATRKSGSWCNWLHMLQGTGCFDDTCKSILLAELRRCLSAATAATAAAGSPSDAASDSSRPDVLGVSSAASCETETSASVAELELSDTEPASDGRVSLEPGRELDDPDRNRLFLSAPGNMLL